MKDYKQISSQVDIFLGSIDPISIEHQFSKNPKVCFKKSLQKISEFIREKVYSQFPSSTSNLGRKAFDPMFMMQVINCCKAFWFFRSRNVRCFKIRSTDNVSAWY